MENNVDYLITIQAKVEKDNTIIRDELFTILAKTTNKLSNDAKVAIPEYFYSAYTRNEEGKIIKGRPAGISNLQHVINSAVKRWYKLSHLIPHRITTDPKLIIRQIQEKTPEAEKIVGKLKPITITFFLESF